VKLLQRVAGLVDRLGLDRLSDRDRRALLIGAVLIVPALLWYAAVRPYMAALAEARAAYETEYALWQREVALLAAAPELPARLDSATAVARTANDRLVRAANEALAENEVIRYLSLIASTNRVLLQEARGTDAANGDAAGELRPVRLALRGESDLRGIMMFLNSVEQSPLLLRVGGLSIEPAPPSGGGGGGGGGGGNRQTNTGVLRFGMLIEAYAPQDPGAP